MNINYRPDIHRDKRQVVSKYNITSSIEEEASTIGREDAILDPIALRYNTAIDEILAIADECDAQILANTSDMSIPIDPSDRSTTDAIKVISGGDHDNYIDQSDFLKVQEIRSNTSYIENIDENVDLMSMLWTEIKIGACNWLADKISGTKIPVVADKLADMFRDEAARLKEGSLVGNIAKMDVRNPTGVVAAYADRIASYIREYSRNYRNNINYDPNAVELKTVLDSERKNLEGVRRLANTRKLGWGTDITTTPGTTDMGDWARREFITEPLKPITDTSKFLDSKIFTDNMWDTAIVGGSMVYTESLNILAEYISGKDLACCLLDNILSSYKAIGYTKYLKALKLALVYFYNGINVKIDDMFNSLVDILNQILALLLNKLMTTVREALDGWVLGIRNYLNDYITSKGDTWKRCYPFDEFIRYAISTLYKMEGDLLDYMSDYLRMLQLSRVDFTDYSILLRKRERLRKYIRLLDAIISGIELGQICKDLRDMDAAYTPLTEDELVGFATNWGAIKGNITVDEAVNRWGKTPDSGLPTNVTDSTGDILSPNEREWLQDCDKSMTDSDIEVFKEGLRSAGII